MNGNSQQNNELNYYIIQNEEKYILNVKILNEIMTLSIKDENILILNIQLSWNLKILLKKINYSKCMIQLMNLKNQ